MIEYLLLAVAFLIVVGVPAVRAGSRRHPQHSARTDTSYNSTDSSGSTWSFGDSSSSRSDSGSCGGDSSADSSSGGDCGGSDSGGGGGD